MMITSRKRKRTTSIILTLTFLAALLTGAFDGITAVADPITIVDVSDNISARSSTDWDVYLSSTPGAGVMEYINFVENGNNIGSVSDGKYVVSQTKSTEWNQRILTAKAASGHRWNLYRFDLQQPVVMEAKFKVKAADYTKGVYAKFRAMLYDGDNILTGDYVNSSGTVLASAGETSPAASVTTPEMSSNIPLSAATEDTLHTFRIVVDNANKQVKGYLDPAANPTPVFTSNFTYNAYNLGMQVVVKSPSATADNIALGTTVTWTYESFKILYGATSIDDGGITPTPTPSQGQFQTLLNLDTGLTLTKNTNNNHDLATTTGTGSVEYIDYTNSNVLSLDAGKTNFLITQTKSTAWHQRILNKEPGIISLNDLVTFETKFKVKAEDYSKNVQVKFQLFSAKGGLSPDEHTFFEPNFTVPMAQATEDTWKTLTFTLDPSTRAIKGYLDGAQLGSQTLSAMPASINSLGIFPMVYNSGNKADGADLASTITWTFDSFKIFSGTDDGGTVTPPEETAAGTVADIDKAIIRNRNSSTWDWNLTSGTGKGTLAYINFTQNLDADTAVTDGSETFSVYQTLATDWQQRVFSMNGTTGSRFNMFRYNLAAPTVMEVKFKVKAADYSKGVFAKLRAVLYNADVLDANTGETISSAAMISSEIAANIPLSAQTEDVWQIFRVVVDNEAKKIYTYLNPDDNPTPQSTASFTMDHYNLGYHVIVKSPTATTDKAALGTTVTWTYDSFKITQGEDAPPTPTPGIPTEMQTLVDIRDNMTLATNTNNNKDLGSATGTGLLEYINWSNASVASLSADGGAFVLRQTRSSAWQQRIVAKNPSEFTNNAPITYSATFKLKADDYSKGVYAKFRLALLAPTLQSWEIPINLPLSADTENIPLTMSFTIDPDQGRIIGCLDDAQILSSYVIPTAESFSSLRLDLIAQNNGKTIEETLALDTPLTWTFESFKITYGADDNETPTPTPGADPLGAPVTAGPWESIDYPAGTGTNDSAQDVGCVVNLGGFSRINKVTINHDSSKIMSFSVLSSKTGLSYLPVTDVYPGELSQFNGTQTYRFAPVDASFVKYRAVLLGDTYATQAKLNSIEVSYAQTQRIAFDAVPSMVNPVDTSEIALHTIATDSDGTYPMSRQGVKYKLEGAPAGVTLNGHIIEISAEAAGSFTVVATDASDEAISALHTIALQPQVSARNFALYNDEGCTAPLGVFTPGETVYARAELLANTNVSNKDATLLVAAYEGSQLIGAPVLVKQEAPAVGGYVQIKAAFTLPPDIGAASKVSAFLWSDSSAEPLLPPVTYSEAAALQGMSAQNLVLDKADTFALKASAGGRVISWESSDTKVAAVSENGLVTAVGEGIATITASITGDITSSISVTVDPSVYVFLQMGQSNSSGTNAPQSEGVAVPIASNVKLLNKSNIFEAASHPYRQHSGVYALNQGTSKPFVGWIDATTTPNPNGGINAIYQFAQLMAEKYPDKTIGVIVNSSSGCSIFSYERNSKNVVTPDGTVNTGVNGFDNTVERILAATAGKGELKGILWHQGESDGNDATYGARLRNFVYDLRKEINKPEVAFIAGGLSEYSTNAGWTQAPNARISGNVLLSPSFGFASSISPFLLETRSQLNSVYPTATTDHTHISAKGQIEFGARYFKQYLDIESKKK